MISNDDLENEMLEDIEYLYRYYISKLKEKKSSVKALNNIIRALKHAHKYYSMDEENNSELEDKTD